MKKILLAICAAALIFLVSCGNEEFEHFGGIHGTVIDRVSGAAISGVSVTLSPNGITRQTNSNGFYEFTNLEPKQYTVSVQHIGYRPQEVNVTARVGESAERNLQIERHPIVLRLVAADGTMNDIVGLNFGSAEDVRSFSIINDNPYPLEWAIANNTEWIIVNQSSGTLSQSGGQQPITVTIDRSKKGEDVNSATIAVTSEAGTRDLVISTFAQGAFSLITNVIPTNSGSVSRSVEAATYPTGTTLTITANPASGYEFVNWTGAQVANANSASTTITLLSNVTLTANFRHRNDNPGGTRGSLADQLNLLHRNAENGGVYTIELDANQNIGTQPLSFSDRRDITIRIAGVGGERVVQLTGNGSLFSVETGITLILDNNITLRGHNANTNPLINVRGTLIMRAGSRIQNNTNTNNDASSAGIAVRTGGVFQMEGGIVSGNTISSTPWNPPARGGGVFVETGGEFLMSGGRISDNNNSGIRTNGIFVMRGGEVSANQDAGIFTSGGAFDFESGRVINNNGSGVRVANSTFTMLNGEITDNRSSTEGGGVRINGGYFTMKGGSIFSNTSTDNNNGGGGVSVSNATFTMEGGNIFGNIATNAGGGVWVGGTGTPIFTKTGGTIHGFGAIGDNNRNVATAGVGHNNRGHTVFVNSNPIRRRETTAGPEVNMDSRETGIVGGWE